VTTPAMGSTAGPRYLLLVDISGYTAFLAGVERTHGEDFSGGLPAGYRALGELLDGVVRGIAPEFDVVKLEGDAVFGAAPAARLEGLGDAVVERLVAMYAAFARQRASMRDLRDDKCVACNSVRHLDLKAILHRGLAVTQQVGGTEDLHGPAVNAAHRLLKNRIRDRIGYRPYLFVTAPAAAGLGLEGSGFEHDESYPDVGRIDGRVLDLAELAGVAPGVPPAAAIESGTWPDLSIAG
jgi:Protein of unknown function (DUF2652)